MFRSVDAEVLYLMIRRYRPHRIIEVGSGFSTEVIWPGSYMHTHHSDKLKKAFASYGPTTVWPEAFGYGVGRHSTWYMESLYVRQL